MRLLYVIDSLAPGGAETSLAELAPGLVRAGIDLHVLPLGNRLDLGPALQQAGAVVHVKQASHQGRLANLRSVIEVARRIQPNLVHTTLFEADIAGRIAATVLRIPTSTSIVGDTYGEVRAAQVGTRKLRLANGVDRATARFASRFHAVSNDLAHAISSNFRIPSDLIEVIPRGRSATRFLYRQPGVRSATRKLLGIAEDRPVILTVGRLEPAKGLIDLLRAMPTVLSQFPNSLVIMAGKDGGASEDLHRAAARLPADTVRFLGHRSDIPKLMTAADMLCFPSLTEGSPGTLIEAMAVGCPILASNIPPNLEILTVGDQVSGSLAPTRNPPALAVALLKVLVESRKGDSLQRLARHRFESTYEIDVVTHRMTRFFTSASKIST